MGSRHDAGGETLVPKIIGMNLGLKPKDAKHLARYVEQLAAMVAPLPARRASRFVFEATARQRARHRARAAYLRTLPQAPQGTEEWFAYRRGTPGPDGVYVGGRLTASDTGTALGMNEYACPEEIIVKKAGVPTFSWSPACEHGKKYEDVTVAIFERREGKTVREYGCIDGRDGRTAASPDGITEDGEAVEIKNPLSRKPTGVPKPAYYAQMQQQLEVLDLEKCHFVETVIREYADPLAYRADHPEGEPDAAWTAAGNEKGVLLEIVDEPGPDAAAGTPPSFRYVYAPLGIRPADAAAWANAELDRLGDAMPDTRSVFVKYWYVQTYLNTPVYRDRLWWSEQQPTLAAFWTRVEEARRDPEVLARALARYREFDAEKQARFGRGAGGKRRRTQRRLRLDLDAGKVAKPAATPAADQEGDTFSALFGPEIEAF